MPNTVNTGGEGWRSDNQAYRNALESAATRYGGAQAPQLLQVLLNMGRLETDWGNTPVSQRGIPNGGYFQISDVLHSEMQRRWTTTIDRNDVGSASNALARFIAEVGTGTGAFGVAYNTPRSDTINLEVGPGMWHGGIGGYTRFLTGNTTQSQDGIGPLTTRYTVQALQGAVNPDQLSQQLQSRYTQLYGDTAWPTAAGNSGMQIGTVGIGSDAHPLPEPIPRVGPNTGIPTDFNWWNQLTWNPLTQEQAGWYAGSPDLTYRGGLGGQEAGWGFYGDTPLAPFYRMTNEQAGWMSASPAADRPTWNPEQNSWGYWGEPPMDVFPTGRMDYMQQLRDFGVQNPGQLQLWDVTPERGFGGTGQEGQRSWYDLFNPVGTAHAGLEPLPQFLQDWDPNIGQGSQGALSVWSPSQIWRQWDPNIASGYPGGVTTWDASLPNLQMFHNSTMGGVDPGNLGMWDFNAANPLNPFSSQYTQGTGVHVIEQPSGPQPAGGGGIVWNPAGGGWGEPGPGGVGAGAGWAELQQSGNPNNWNWNPATLNWGTFGGGTDDIATDYNKWYDDLMAGITPEPEGGINYVGSTYRSPTYVNPVPTTIAGNNESFGNVSIPNTIPMVWPTPNPPPQPQYFNSGIGPGGIPIAPGYNTTPILTTIIGPGGIPLAPGSTTGVLGI